MDRYFLRSKKEVYVIVLTLCQLCAAAAKKTCEPQEDVVSIYSDKFDEAPPPQGFGPYFIKIHRCAEYSQTHYPSKPVRWQKIGIVLRDSLTFKYYEYILHNHTKCKCSTNLTVFQYNRERRVAVNVMLGCSRFR
ncbi:uncharacterized protein LOC124435578 [Xenia sp. Carnegie-2017]|uniref:uncharacterized protein LOC124435578 n=1 Tax=Xenia sp. Carnegie-2017 TaxID=2897299 RepID=UPI001F03F36E|nr:uncharacterized protein LOC124435578 [Xenia sp. Carnegie-2017]